MSIGKLRDHLDLGKGASGSARTITLNGVKFEGCRILSWRATYGTRTIYGPGKASDIVYTEEDDVDVTFQLQGGTTVRVQGNVKLTGD